MPASQATRSNASINTNESDSDNESDQISLQALSPEDFLKDLLSLELKESIRGEVERIEPFYNSLGSLTELRSPLYDHHEPLIRSVVKSKFTGWRQDEIEDADGRCSMTIMNDKQSKGLICIASYAITFTDSRNPEETVRPSPASVVSRATWETTDSVDGKGREGKWMVTGCPGPAPTMQSRGPTLFASIDGILAGNPSGRRG